MNVQELFVNSPVAVSIVTVVAIVILHYSRGLSYREYMTIHGVKRVVFPLLDSHARKRGRPLIRYKGGNQDPEYVMSVVSNPRDLSKSLRKHGFVPNILSTLKAREAAQSPLTYSHSQWAYHHDDGLQTDVSLFVVGDEILVYSHVETSTTDPDGHLENEQTSGDPKGVVKEALA